MLLNLDELRLKDHVSALRGGGVQGQISWKHNFEITGDPKDPPSGLTFWWSFEAPDSYLLSPKKFHTIHFSIFSL